MAHHPHPWREAGVQYRGSASSFNWLRNCAYSGSTLRTVSQKRGLWFMTRRWLSSCATT